MAALDLALVFVVLVGGGASFGAGIGAIVSAASNEWDDSVQYASYGSMAGAGVGLLVFGWNLESMLPPSKKPLVLTSYEERKRGKELERQSREPVYMRIPMPY